MQAWQACKADPPRYGPPRNLNFRGSRRMPFGRDTGIIQGYLLRTSHSLSLLSGTDSASIIPEIGFGDGGVGGGVYILYVRVHLNGDRNGERHPCDLRAPSSYGDSKQQRVLTGLANLHLVGIERAVQ